MDTLLKNTYSKFKANKPFMLEGRDSEMSLRAAKTLLKWEELENRGLVRIKAEDEEESYFDVFGREDDKEQQKATEDLIERWGCVYVSTEYFDGSSWQLADSIGMCVYENPTSPFENCYVIDLMNECIEQLEKHWQDDASGEH